MTTEKYFKSITNKLNTHLNAWIAFYSKDHPMEPNLPPPGLAFRNQQYDEGSDGSFASYMSACSSIYTVQDETYDLPPPPKGPAPQAWGHEIPKELQSSAPTHVVSGISQDEYDKVTRDNAKLSRKIDELTTQVTALLAQGSAATRAPSVQQDRQMLIEETTRAVLEAIYAQQKALAENVDEPANTTLPEDDMNVSFDSSQTYRQHE
jgi:hypothetical protein